MLPKFDADTAALAPRSSLNADNSDISLEEWWWGLLPRNDFRQVLDLGCGLGKQAFFVAGRLPGAAVTAIDVSPEAVSAVNERAAIEGVDVRAQRVGFDDCLPALAGRQFDLIVSAYAIYYASDMVGLIRDLRAHLRADGCAVILGFGAGSNGEVVELANQLGGSQDDRIAPVPDFITEAELFALRAAYGHVDTVRLANRVAFRSADDFMRWWSNHNSFRPSIAEAVASAVAREIEVGGIFHLAKNVLALIIRA